MSSHVGLSADCRMCVLYQRNCLTVLSISTLMPMEHGKVIPTGTEHVVDANYVF